MCIFQSPSVFQFTQRRENDKKEKKEKETLRAARFLRSCRIIQGVSYEVDHAIISLRFHSWFFFFLLIFTTLYSSNLARISFQRCRRRYAGRIREKRALIASTFASVLREQQQQSRNNIVTCPRGCSYGGELSHDSRKTKLVVSLSAR